MNNLIGLEIKGIERDILILFQMMSLYTKSRMHLYSSKTIRINWKKNEELVLFCRHLRGLQIVNT